MDVKELLDSKNIEHVNRGRDYEIKCLNPDHEDNNPSMRVDKLTGIFGCFSCGCSGDIFKYFNIKNTQYLDVKTKLLLDKINELIWTKPLNLPLDSVPFIQDYRGIKASTFEEFGAFTTDYLLGMEGRVVFPIMDINDNIKCFQGRYIYSELIPKYKFYPSEANVPLYPARVTGTNSIVLVEGFFDFLNLYDKGVKNVVCTFGTSFGSVKKKEKQQKNIERLLTYRYQGVNTIYIMYDGDIAGRSAAKNLESYIGSTFNVEIIELGDNIDPGSLTKEQVHELRNKVYE